MTHNSEKFNLYKQIHLTPAKVPMRDVRLSECVAIRFLIPFADEFPHYVTVTFYVRMVCQVML